MGSIRESSPSSSSSSSDAEVLCQKKSRFSDYVPGFGSGKRKSGRKKFHETRHPIYKGVRERNGKWVSEMRDPHKKSRVWLGTFTDPDMAARTYDVAALAIIGDSAYLNFPQTSPDPSLSSSTEGASMVAQASLANTDMMLPMPPPSSSSSFSSLPFYTTNVDLERDQEMSSTAYYDEEEIFNMPGIMVSLAEGLMITPPATDCGFYLDNEDDADMEDLPLWSDG